MILQHTVHRNRMSIS